LELIPVLAECVIEGARVWQSLPSSDEFNHLSSFCDIDGVAQLLGAANQASATHLEVLRV
jgi:hypothetical protein